jgi:hypothetical protein
MKRIIVAAGIIVFLAACGGKDNSGDTSSATTLTTQTQGPSTTVKVPTAREFIAGFKRAGLPVGKVICYTDETDPNDLLGRPGGYVEKCDWADKREEQSLPDDPIGGSIETFERPGGAVQRAEYLKAFEGAGAFSSGYTYLPKNSNWVLRIDSELTKSQAQAYLKAFEVQL